MYRLDHRSLTIKPSQFVTSAVDIMRYTVQGFQKQGKIALIETLKVALTKSLKTYFRV